MMYYIIVKSGRDVCLEESVISLMNSGEPEYLIICGELSDRGFRIEH